MTLPIKFPENYWNRKKLTRRERTSLRDTAAYLLQPEHGRGRAVCACGHSGKGTKFVTLFLKGDGTAGTNGTLRCGSPWLCADCAPLKANQRLDRLKNLADALVKEEGKMASVTITVGHDRSSRLQDLKNAIEVASRKARQGAPWNRKKALHDVIGVLSAPEVTYSFRHGWHFHIHHAFLTGKTGNPEELGYWFVKRYLIYLAKAGFVADIQGQKVSMVRNPRRFFSYLKKGVGRTSQGDFNLDIDGGGKDRHLHPFDILEKASGCRIMKLLWQEYADVMPGTRSCVITHSIAVRLNINLDDDAIDIEHRHIAGNLPASVWKTLVNRRKTNVILSLLEDRGAEAWQQISLLAQSLAAENSPTSLEVRQEKIPMYAVEHRPSAAQIANLARNLRSHMKGKERNGDAIRAALDRERTYAAAKGLAYYPPELRHVLEIYGNFAH